MTTPQPRKLAPNQSPDPTPEEIRLMCLLIQSEWTEAEERQRRGWSITGHVVPGVDAPVKVSRG